MKIDLELLKVLFAKYKGTYHFEEGDPDELMDYEDLELLMKEYLEKTT